MKRPSLRRLSFRWRILLVVLAVGVMPLALIAFWLTGSTARSGEALLRARLRAAVAQDVRGVEASWVALRSGLLDLMESQPVQTLFLEGGGSQGLEGEVEAIFDRTATDVPAVVLISLESDTLARLGQARSPDWSSPQGLPGTIRVDLPVLRRGSDQSIGSLESSVSLTALRPGSTGTALTGGVLTALDPETGTILLPIPFDPSLLRGHLFQWNQETWVVERAQSLEPPLTIVAAAPLTPFSEPFRTTALQGSLILLLVALVGAGSAAILTHRITASLERVESAASAVAGGDLDRTVPEEGEDEVGKLARAFNRMTESLRATLAKVAERESLTAVNEFAAALAHEVRNPLTSIKLDLQQVEEALPEGSEVKDIQGQALEDLIRLDRAVQGALETARSGTITPRRETLLVPLRNAIRAAQPRAQERGVTLLGPVDDASPISMDIDPDALERVFLNLILNGVDASTSGGAVEVKVGEDAAGVWVRVTDEGGGMSSQEMKRVFTAFYSTRPGGTGVGLTIARRIVLAHGGELSLESTPGVGTSATVRLPPSGSPSSKNQR